jgi:hypothetical protein
VLQGVAERPAARTPAPPSRAPERSAPLQGAETPVAPAARATAIGQIARGIARRAQG